MDIELLNHLTAFTISLLALLLPKKVSPEGGLFKDHPNPFLLFIDWLKPSETFHE